jgi:predicted HicB family RNase H-like nuclease
MKKIYSLYLDQEVMQKLQAKAETQNVSLSTFVEDILIEWLEIDQEIDTENAGG